MDSIKGLVRSPGCLQVSPLKRHSRALAWWNGRKTRPCSPYKPSKSLNLERTSWVHTPTKYIKILFCGTRMVSPFFLKEAVNWMNISLVGTLQGCRSTIHESSSCYLLLEIPDYEWHWIRIFPKWRSSPYSISRNPHAKEARYAITAHGLEPPYACLSCSRSKTCLLSGWKTGCNNRWRTSRSDICCYTRCFEDPSSNSIRNLPEAFLDTGLWSQDGLKGSMMDPLNQIKCN